MSKRNLSLLFPALITAALTLSCTSPKSGPFHPSEWVNPKIGASTSTDAAGVYHGLGKTFPGAATPLGLVQVSPNTITGGDNAPGYSDEHQTIEGFCFTQMSGVGWYGDLGNFLVMPTTGPLLTSAGLENGSVKGWRSRYDKQTETARAGYYSAYLSDYGILAEATADQHSGTLRFTFPKSDTARIQIDLARRVAGSSSRQYVRIVNDSTLEGWMRCPSTNGGWGNGDGKADYTVYFHARLSRPMERYGFWSADIPDSWQRKRDDVVRPDYMERVLEAPVTTGIREMGGPHIGFFTEMATKEGEQVTLKAGISFVDMEGARRNLEAEVGRCGFEETRRKAQESWDQALGAISVEGASEDDLTIFYTALYHCMIDPRAMADVDGRYRGGDGQIITTSGKFTKRTIFSGWDVYRSQMPLLTLIRPDVVSDMIQSLVTLAEETQEGYLERWEFFNAYSGCMVGNPAISVIADAYTKGIRGFDIEKAYELSKASSGRGIDPEVGYIPGSISETLEYAYADYCLGVLAGALGKAEDEAFYMQKAASWKNIFDKEKGWMRPRSLDGSFWSWPENGRIQDQWGCVESNPYQQGWFVPHDIEGLMEFLGGREAMLNDLENFFDHTPLDFHWNDYYNHANEPVHFAPYIFNRLGAPHLTQKWTRTILRGAYHNSVEGICGNDDCGQMSAWYVLSAIGIHPACPGDGTYEITSPLFKKAILNLPSGKTFTIKANDNSGENLYIQKARLNGQPLSEPRITHEQILKGGVLELWMGPEPAEWN